MSRKRVPPEAQIIALFTGLSPEAKRMVMFGLNAIVGMEPPAPKSSAPVAEKKSKQKSEKQPSIPSIGTATGNVSDAPKGEMCGTCGFEPDFQDHFQPSPNYHEFEGKKAKQSAA